MRTPPGNLTQQSRYRTACIKSRIIPLPPDVISYLREDGIVLADDDESGATEDDNDDWEPSGPSSRDCPPPNISHADDSDSDTNTDGDRDGESPSSPPPRLPPNKRFPALHDAIKDAIKQLGGAAAPKLNWSSPKDAAWISRHANTVKCTTPNDVYMLLKSSSFASHDLEHAFDDTVAAPSWTATAATTTITTTTTFQPVLVLRAFFSPVPSLEFRCFVKDRTLVAITARDLNYYPFLRGLRAAVIARARALFRARLRFTFPEACFVFDVYIPEADWDVAGGDESRLGRARLVDINPWAPRTDTLLFDWQELLALRVPRPLLGSAGEAGDEGVTDDSAVDDDDDEDYEPELRIVEQYDPAAYNFSSPQYSAHKLPKEVVDASMAGEGGMREFARRWQGMTGQQGVWETGQ